VDWDGLRFTVRAGDERRVAKVEIARRRAEPDEAEDGDEPERVARAAHQGT